MCLAEIGLEIFIFAIPRFDSHVGSIELTSMLAWLTVGLDLSGGLARVFGVYPSWMQCRVCLKLMKASSKDCIAMTNVAQILRSKSDNVVHKIDADESVYDAVRLMAEEQIGSLLVMEGGEIAGIVTERDYARKMALLGRESRTTAVREIMSTRVLFVQPEQTCYECMALMSEHHLRHLPVLELGTIVGIISIGDLVKEIIADQRFIIEQLEHYVRS